MSDLQVTEDGRYLGGGIPFGYRLWGDRRVEVPAELDACATAIRLVKQGKAYAEIAAAVRTEHGGILPPDFTEYCTAVKVATIVMRGREDRTTPLAFTNELTRLIDGAIERVIPTGHPGVFDDPTAFNAPLIEFLDAQPR